MSAERRAKALLGLVCASQLALAGCGEKSSEPPAGAPDARLAPPATAVPTAIPADLSTFRARFDEDRELTRLVMLVSPT